MMVRLGRFHDASWPVNAAAGCETASVKLELNIPALVFPAGSFLMLAYTNRYLTLASLIRALANEWRTEQDPRVQAQIEVLRKRINLIRVMQSFAVGSMLLCILSMIAIYADWRQIDGFLFVGGLMFMAMSLLVSAAELQLSTKALNLQLELVESDAKAQLDHR
jgi:Protein of unknown function (DUF2721)